MQIYKFSKEGLEKALYDAKLENQIKEHFIQYGNMYIKAVVIAGVFILIPEEVLAKSTIDAKGEELYRKLASLGRWIILIKGGIEIIQNSTQGDFVSARKSGLSYGISYAILLALPKIFKEVESLVGGL